MQKETSTMHLDKILVVDDSSVKVTIAPHLLIAKACRKVMPIYLMIETTRTQP
jgi:hypothetical protein